MSPRFEIFFGHQIPEEEDEIDLNINTDQGMAANMDVEEGELLGKTLTNLLTNSTVGTEADNLGDSFTISMIGDKPTADFTNLIVDASEASHLV